MNRQYELVYIVAPDATEQQVTDLHAQVESIIGRYSGQLERTENWGRRKMAYEIAHHKEGTYVLEVINGSGELMKEIDRRLKVSDRVIRHLVVRVDQDLKVTQRVKARRDATTARRRQARGLSAEIPAGERRAPTGEDDRVERTEV